MKHPERCKKCIYWRPMAKGVSAASCCHHLLDTGNRRMEVAGVCKSLRLRGKKGGNDEKRTADTASSKGGS